MPDHSSHRGKIILAIITAVILAGWGIFSRHEAEANLRDTTEELAIPAVNVMKAQGGPASEEIILPGTVQAWHEAPIYARTNGYIKEWKTDIGTHVEPGDELAEIETPEVDAQLHQAEADLGTARANNALAQSTAKRWLALLKTNSVSKQETDEKVSAATAMAATEASARANVDRLRQLEEFKHVLAPFAGVITTRNIDNGSLINAGSGTAAGVEMFHIAELKKLRIYVQVPELYTAAVMPELTAELHFTEHPGKHFDAKLVDTAHALDPATRTLLVQFEEDNAGGELMPGGYTEVHMKLPASGAAVRLPVNTLIFCSAGIQVGIVDGESKAQLKSITIGRDFGKEVEVVAGVSPGDTVIVNPPDSLTSGEKVRVVTEASKEKEEKKADKDEDAGKKKPAADANKITPEEKQQGVVIKNEGAGNDDKKDEKK